MATVEVTTWAELIAAVTTGASGDVIQIMNDIDCNNEIPLGAYSSTQKPGITIDGSYTETENGVTVTKNRVIRNLRTRIDGAQIIFLASTTGSNNITWKNIDFVNLYLDAALFSVNGIGTMTFDHCRFVGKRTGALIDMITGTSSYTDLKCTFVSCFFNIPNVSQTADIYRYRLIDKFGSNTANRDNVHTTANYCWFRETNTGKVFDTPAAQSYSFYKSGCYTDGDILVKASLATDVYSVTGTAGKIDINQSNGTIQSVCDAQIIVVTPDTEYPLGSVGITGGKGLFKTLGKHLNTDTIIPSTDFVNNNSTYTIFATPAEMTDPAALYAKGFDIVVP